jgi:hypothetical protein
MISGDFLLQHRVVKSLRADLPMLDDAAVDFEVGHQLEGVHDGGHTTPGALDEKADFGEEGVEAVRPRIGRCSGFLRTNGFLLN